jgi:hypothetical protein
MTWANAKIKRIMIWDKQVRPKWTPWSNTIAYYPLTDNYSDASGNCSDVVRSNTSSQIWTYHWVKCFNMNNYYSTVSTINNMNWLTSYTWSLWGWSSTWHFWVMFRQSTDNWWAWWLDMYNTTTTRWRYWNPTNKNTTFTMPSVSNWHHFVLSVSWWKSDIYIDWVRVAWLNSWVVAPVNNAAPLVFGSYTLDTSRCDWCVSNLIIEKVWWTAEQVKDYFDSTKKAYWF